jgi:hypothetical protein
VIGNIVRQLCERTETARNNEKQNKKQIENEWGEKQEVRMRRRNRRRMNFYSVRDSSGYPAPALRRGGVGANSPTARG